MSLALVLAALALAALPAVMTVVNLRALERTIQFDVRGAVRRLRASAERLRTSKATVAAAGERERAESIRYQEARLGTLQDVLGAQARVANAQTTHLRALIDLNIARVDLERLTGTLVESASLALSPGGDRQ